MKSQQIIIILSFGLFPLFLSHWIEPMFPLGSWRWGILSIGSLGIGITFAFWNKLKEMKFWKMPGVQLFFAIVFGPPIFIWAMGLLITIWGYLFCFFDQECVNEFIHQFSERYNQR